jgi:hypothetical protein
MYSRESVDAVADILFPLRTGAGHRDDIILSIGPLSASLYLLQKKLFSMLGSRLEFATARECAHKEILMPVKTGRFWPLSEAEFTELRQQKARKSDPATVTFLTETESGRSVRVPLVEGQSTWVYVPPSAGPRPVVA